MREKLETGAPTPSRGAGCGCGSRRRRHIVAYKVDQPQNWLRASASLGVRLADARRRRPRAYPGAFGSGFEPTPSSSTSPPSVTDGRLGARAAPDNGRLLADIRNRTALRLITEPVCRRSHRRRLVVVHVVADRPSCSAPRPLGSLSRRIAADDGLVRAQPAPPRRRAPPHRPTRRSSPPSPRSARRGSRRGTGSAADNRSSNIMRLTWHNTTFFGRSGRHSRAAAPPRARQDRPNSARGNAVSNPMRNTTELRPFASATSSA